MIELRNPENVLIEIEKGELLAKVAEFKKKNNRLCQICATYVNEKFELSYSFVDDETNRCPTFAWLWILPKKFHL